MLLFAATLHALAPLFLLILLGYGLKRARVLHAAHVPVLNGLVVNVTFPALIVHSLAVAPVLPTQTLRLPLALLLAELLVLALAFGLGRVARLPRPTWGALLMTATFGNTGFLGYPITLALLPRQFPAAILIDQFGMTIPMYVSVSLIGASFGATGADRTAVLARFFRSPMFWAVLVGGAARLISWPSIPGADVVAQCLTYLGQGTTPLVLLALGVALRPGAVRARPGAALLACALKLFVLPLLMWVVCRLLGLNGDERAVGVLMAAMPTAVMASVLSGQHDLDGDWAVGVVFVSTVLSAVTMPLLMAVLR